MNIIFLPQRPYKQLTVLNLMCSHQSMQYTSKSNPHICLYANSSSEQYLPAFPSNQPAIYNHSVNLT